MTKQQINIAHCVQCGRELLGQVEIESKQIGVCHRPECPNYGLLQISIEKIKEFIESMEEDNIEE